jgi:hypothetical protein
MEPITGDVEAFHHGLADLDALFAGSLARYASIDILALVKSLDDSVELCTDNWIFSVYENIADN